jgi:replicative DNA helicase
VFVDYLQLMNAPNAGSREQEISTISRQLKAIAKELEIPVIALSQLNRSIDKTNEYRPQLSNLRESGAIEQDADIVAFIHRPEYYKILEDSEGNSTVGMAEIIIAKHRNGALEDIQLRFEKEFAKFSENFEGILPTSLSDITFGDKPKMNFSSKMNAETTTFSNNPVLIEPFPTNKFDPFDAPF